MTSENWLNLPSKETLEQWNSLSVNPLPGTSAITAPQTIYISYSNEEFFNRTPFEKTNPMITAPQNISQIKLITEMIKHADTFIYPLYSRRSLSQAICTFISTNTKTTYPAALSDYESVFNFVKDMLGFIKDSIGILHRLFDIDTFWKSGLYSSELLDATCTLFFKLTTLDEMKLIKSTLINDLTNFKSLAKGTGYSDDNLNALRVLLAQSQYVDSALLKEEQSRKSEDKKIISSIFTTYIIDQLDRKDLLRPELTFIYLRFLMFLCKYVDQDSKTISFLTTQVMTHPFIPLAFEVSISAVDYCSGIKNCDALKKFTVNPKAISNKLLSLKLSLESMLSTLPQQIAKANEGTLNYQDFYKYLLELIYNVGCVKNGLREQLAFKLTFPPAPANPEQKMMLYERSIRLGYTQEDLSLLIQLLNLWRSLCDQLRNSSGTIMEILGPYIYQRFQVFVKENCGKIISRAQKKYEAKLKDMVETLGTFVGDWKPEEKMYQSTKSKEKSKGRDRSKSMDKSKVADRSSESIICNRICYPNLAAIEFVRVQMQHITNPQTEYMHQGGKKAFKKEKMIKEINEFLATSSEWTTFLQFGQLITNLADQSDLFFKEAQLDLNKTITFPIKSCLPYVLCEYALQNFMKPEVTQLVFYPLGIFDDAARVAQQKLKSQIILDETRAESQMCVQALKSMIADFIYFSFKSFVSLQLFPDLSNEKAKSKVRSTAYRLTALLRQDYFYLHYQLVDIKSLIIGRIEDHIYTALQNFYRTAKQNFGSMIAITDGIRILEETHRMLTDQGVTLARFDIFLKSIFDDTSAESFVSSFSKMMLENLTKKVARHCYLQTNPLRFSSKNTSLPHFTFGKNDIGQLLKDLYDPTVTTITVEHFCAFQKLMNDGSMSYFIKHFIHEFDHAVKSFINEYKEILNLHVKRVQDPPLASQAQTIFDTYEGTYTLLADEDKIKSFFLKFKVVGNMLAMANMIDISMLNSKLTKTAILSYLRGVAIDGKSEKNDLEHLLPKQLAELLKNDKNTIPDGRDVYPITLSFCISILMDNLKENWDCFDEKSTTILYFPSLTGFAAVWSVLEFIFIYSEAFRDAAMESPFELLGEGEMLAAAAVILCLKQERIYFASNIGRKIQRVKEVDFAANKEEKLIQFCAVNEFETSVMKWAFSIFQPIIRHINNNGTPAWS